MNWGISILYRRNLFLAYLVALFILTIIPINGEHSYTLNNSFVIHIRLDHLLHGITFLPFIFLGKWGTKCTNLNLILLGLLLSIGLESIQLFLSYRTFKINDMIYNSIGVILGSIAFLIPFRQHQS